MNFGCSEELLYLAFLPYNRNLYRNGGWKVAPGDAAFSDFLAHYFPLNVRERARAAARSLSPMGRDCQAFCIWEDRYPDNLRRIFDPPVVLFHKGPLEFLAEPALSIVGTRKPDPVSVLATELLVDSSEQAIVSGFALGIDRVAHERSQLRRRSTIAVLASCVDRPSPLSHLYLLKKPILLLSEYPPGTAAYAGHFPRRNRIIAGLAPTVAIMQAPARSGALITAEFALEEGREVLVFDDDRLSGVANAGNRRLLFEGARPLRLEGRVLCRPRVNRREQLLFFEAKALGQLRYLGGDEYGILPSFSLKLD
ncbi:MAG: DNA-protecting protein DprA [Spirochaetales bacterium]|nr:DNA-protecting protein DprA [Spirochaetales bacterium]